MNFLSLISWPFGYSIIDLSKNTLFVGVKLAKYQFNGSIDVILLDDGSVASKNYVNNIRLGIEIKKEVKDQDHSQAILASRYRCQ